MSDSKVALVGAESENLRVVREVLEDRQDVERVGPEDGADLIIYVGPLSESPYSGCDNHVRQFPLTEGKQSVRLKTLAALRSLDEDKSYGGKGTYAEAVRDEAEE